MEKATAAKYALEQKQRDEARSRKENNTSWQTKVNLLSLLTFLYYINEYNRVLLIAV